MEEILLTRYDLYKGKGVITHITTNLTAGEIEILDIRKEWSDDPNVTLSTLASPRNDMLKVPAESCRNISVSALKPVGLDNVIPYALANYSCRGPVSRVGLNPDFCHFEEVELIIG